MSAPPHRGDNNLDGDKRLAAQRAAQRSVDVRVKSESSIRQAVTPDAPAERSEAECQGECSEDQPFDHAARSMLECRRPRFGRFLKDFGRIVTMETTFPRWQGFELAPQGFLLEQVIDLQGEMGIAYERVVDFYKDFHTHDRLSIVCPRGACVMEIKTGNRGDAFTLDSGVLLVLPPGHVHDIEARSSVFDAIALYPAGALLKRVAREDRIAAPALDRFTRSLRKLRRSPWLEQLLVEYFSRRVLGAREGGSGRPAPGLRFFERELTREVFRSAGLGHAQRGAGEKSGPREGIANRALQFIEANLFGPLELDAIAGHAHASVSTLLRHFAQRTGLAPLQYARARRLDEARTLLNKGTCNVTEVAMLVGYENAGAFCEAFRAQFGKPPSRARGGIRRRGARRIL